MITNAADSRRSRLVYIVTSTKSLFFFRGFIAELCANRFDVSVISSPGPGQDSIRAEGASIIDVPMRRDIASPLVDLMSLWRLWRALRRIRPDITNVGTTKAGLLGGLAAVLARVPHRVYTLHGLRMETVQGWKSKLLWFTEWVACRCAHQVHCVSQSVRDRAVELRIVDSNKATVIANGTCNGIEHERFAPTPERREDAVQLRTRLNIQANALVIGFVGRLNKAKGTPELYEAFLRLRTRYPSLRLLFVGDYDGTDTDAVPDDVRDRIDADALVIRTGWITDPAPYYHVMDVFAFPTHREGFGLVSIEAQAAEVPVVATTATGVRDSVLDGVSGFLTPVGDVRALTEAIEHLLHDAELRRQMGKAGHSWVARTFDRQIVWADIKNRYRQAVTQQLLPLHE